MSFGRRVMLRGGLIGLIGLVGLLAGCGSLGGVHDGPPREPPPHLDQVPNAVPRFEPVRSGGPNKPYALGGQRYEPLPATAPLIEKGLGSWYGTAYHGRPTANGEIYDMYAMTAAHPTLPLPSYARVRNPANGREVVVRINDRGPFVPGRIIDLSYTAALRLDLLRGVAPVEVERILPPLDIEGALFEPRPTP
jgi:rare lipoprotein A